jgi:hypothetical protein
MVVTDALRIAISDMVDTNGWCEADRIDQFVKKNFPRGQLSGSAFQAVRRRPVISNILTQKVEHPVSNASPLISGTMDLQIPTPTVMDQVRAWHVYDISTKETTSNHVKWSFAMSECYSMTNNTTVDQNETACAAIYSRNKDACTKMCSRASMTRLGVLYLGRAIVVRSGSTRTLDGVVPATETTRRAETKRLVQTLMENIDITLFAVIPQNNADVFVKEAPCIESWEKFNICYKQLCVLEDARQQTTRTRIQEAVGAIYDTGNAIVVLSIYDALMPCAAMPTAPMQFDMCSL